MKKIIFALSAAVVFSWGFSSCQKDEGRVQKNHQVNTVQTLSSMTPGDMHNKMLSQYFAEYGYNKPGYVTKDDAALISNRIANYLKLEITSIDPDLIDEVGEAVLQHMDANGYFNSQNRLIAMTDVNTKIINILSNVSLRTALHNINNYGRTDAQANQTYCTNQLTALSLSGSDAQIRDGILSVSNSSFSYWSGHVSALEPTTPDEVLSGWVTADKVAFAIYYNKFLDMGIGVYESAVAAGGFAGAWSKYCYDKFGY